MVLVIYRCEWQPQCTLVVTSKVFGDPCKTTPKYLEVMWHCVGKNHACIPCMEQEDDQPNLLTCLIHTIKPVYICMYFVFIHQTIELHAIMVVLSFMFNIFISPQKGISDCKKYEILFI